MSEHGVALFATTSAAMKAEKALAKAGIPVKMIPTPREFASDCGVAVRFAWDRCAEVEAVLDSQGVRASGIHQMV